MLVTAGVITGGIIRMLGMADGVVKAILIMAGTMAFTVEDFVVTHIVEVVLIMAGIMVDTMVETNGETDLTIMAEIDGGMDLIMAGVETEDSVMPIMVEVILMEV
jgi:hypothetical protein